MKSKPPMRDWSFIDPQGAMRKSIFKIKRTECDNYFAVGWFLASVKFNTTCGQHMFDIK
jgi:hypothetical protein